jgi:hypothetical protein
MQRLRGHTPRIEPHRPVQSNGSQNRTAPSSPTVADPRKGPGSPPRPQKRDSGPGAPPSHHIIICTPKGKAWIPTSRCSRMHRPDQGARTRRVTVPRLRATAATRWRLDPARLLPRKRKGGALQRPHVAVGVSAGRRGGASVETGRWGGAAAVISDFCALTTDERVHGTLKSFRESAQPARGEVPGRGPGGDRRQLLA